MIHPRRIQVNRTPLAGDLDFPVSPVVIPTATTNSDRANPVMPGDLLVQCTAADSSAGDAISAADSTGTPGRKILGLVHKVTDDMGRALWNASLSTTQSGLAWIINVTDLELRFLEDGVGGGIADADVLKYAALIRGTATDMTQTETETPNPEPGTMIDSSTVSSGTASNRAIHLQGIVPDVSNTGSQRVFVGKITSAFLA